MSSPNFPIYTITSVAKGPNGQTLYLNADNFNTVTVQYSQTTTSEWFLLYVPSSGNVAIMNVSSGAILAVGDHNSVIVSHSSTPTNTNTWSITGSVDGAIRPIFDTDLNLNVAGDSYPAGTPVIVYKWDKANNSKWNINLATAS